MGTSLSTPLAVLTSPSDVLTYTATYQANPAPAAYVYTWPYINNVLPQQGPVGIALLCIDTWGAGGTGGFGLYSATGQLCGGGGGSGGFTRTFVQLNLTAVSENAVSSTLTITRNGFTLSNNCSVGIVPGGSSAVLSMPSNVANAGGAYSPAQPVATPAAAGVGGLGAVAQLVVAPDPAQPALPASATINAQPTYVFPTPFTVKVNNFDVPNLYTVVQSTNNDLKSLAIAGLPGRAGANGGTGAPAIVAGGFAAGGGGDGIGRDKNGVTATSSTGPMTVVYLIAVHAI